MLLLFLALAFLPSLLVSISSPVHPTTGHLSVSQPASGERRLPLPAGQGPGQAGQRCPHPTSIRATARTTMAVEKSG